MRPNQTPDYDSYNRPHQWYGKVGESQYIPGWYEPHRDLDQEVTADGQPMGLKIRNVLPHRRWAIDSRGEVMRQADFEASYLRYVDAMKYPETHQIQMEAVPNARFFVRQKPDVGGNAFVDFAFDDDDRVIKEAKYTQDGEIAPEFTAKERSQLENAGVMKTLVRMMQVGKLSPEEFAEQAAAILGDDDLPTVKAAPAKAKRGRPRGEMSEEGRAAFRERMAKSREERRKTSLVLSPQPPPPDGAA